MTIKKKYRLYSRIDVVISLIVCFIIITKMSANMDRIQTIHCYLSCFTSLCTLLLFICNQKKEQAIDKMLGFLKTNGDQWLGDDGNWHDGYHEIMNRKIKKYYDNNGPDLGYLFGPFATVLSILVIMSGIAFSIEYSKEMHQAMFVVYAWTVYLIFRKAVFG